MNRVVHPAAMAAVAWVAARHAGTAAVRARLNAANGMQATRLPVAVRAPIERALGRAGILLVPEAALQLWVVGMATAVVVVAGFGWPAMVVSAVVVRVCPPAAVMLLRRRAEGQFEAALPGALRSIAADVRAGATVRAAIERLALTPSPVAADFDRVRRRLELGAGLAAAVEPWIVERPSSSVRVVVGALSCTDEVGGSAATALDGVAASLSDRLAVAAEARAQSAQARVSAIVVGAAPLGYLAFAAASDRDAISDLISRPIGRMCLTGAVLLDALAVVWMRRIVRTPESS